MQDFRGTANQAVLGSSRLEPKRKFDNYMHKIALITGITGQDGSYLAEFLIAKGLEVHGLMRRSSSFNTGRLAQL